MVVVRFHGKMEILLLKLMRASMLGRRDLPGSRWLPRPLERCQKMGSFYYRRE